MDDPNHRHDLLESQVQAIIRFPDHNPNPVLLVADDGYVSYANRSSDPIRRALGTDVGGRLSSEQMDGLRDAARAGVSVELRDGLQVYAVLPVPIPDLGFINLYGTDITAQKVIERFPNQNPNPVFRVDGEGRLVYANAASLSLINSFGLELGDTWPTEIARGLIAASETGQGESIELEAEYRTFALRPVHVPEFGFINVYGTDVTAEKVVAKFPNQNPNPVLRTSTEGTLIYANDASAPIVEALGLVAGESLPSELHAEIAERLAGGSMEPVECHAGTLVFELVAVPIPEFGFVNIYGTDVTAAREVERLLLNILPKPIADRLRTGEPLIADRFDDASLLIADIVGFTEISTDITPNELVEMLNEIFGRFDRLVESHRLEKVKTIGDAYIVVGGVPIVSSDHVARMASLALDMVGAIDEMQNEMQSIKAGPLRFRIGMSCGPIVAGVIGAKRTIYDVWGDTVNVCSRMESLGEPGRIHVSEDVFARLRDSFSFEPRGEIEVKGKGVLATYYLLGPWEPGLAEVS